VSVEVVILLFST